MSVALSEMSVVLSEKPLMAVIPRSIVVPRAAKNMRASAISGELTFSCVKDPSIGLSSVLPVKFLVNPAHIFYLSQDASVLHDIWLMSIGV